MYTMYHSLVWDLTDDDVYFEIQNTNLLSNKTIMQMTTYTDR